MGTVFCVIWGELIYNVGKMLAVEDAIIELVQH